MGRERELTRSHVLVRGHVQGVGFRWFVRDHARLLGLSGSVRNRSDGAVEVRAEGTAAGIDELLEHLRRGPQGASVDRLEQLNPAGDDASLPSPFAIVR